MCNRERGFLPPKNELPINSDYRLPVGTKLLLDTGKEVKIIADEKDWYIVVDLSNPEQSVKFGISVWNIKKIL